MNFRSAELFRQNGFNRRIKMMAHQTVGRKLQRLMTAALFLLLVMNTIPLLHQPCKFSDCNQQIYELKQTERSEREFLPCNASRLGASNRESKKERPVNILLLSSMGRSGSSFLGGLLSSLPGNFYFYEPLLKLEQWKLLTADVGVKSLKALLTCNLSEPVRSALTARDSRKIGLPNAHRCSSSTVCFSAEAVEAACLRKRFRIVKTIRSKVSWLPQLLSDAEVNLRVIHLVRDPRGSITSMKRAGWFMPVPGRHCDRLYSDIQEGLQLQNQFRGKYLLATTTASGPERIYGIKRNTHSQQQRWRSTINETDFLSIEKVCASCISQIGFNLFGNLSNVRDYSLPLYNETATTSIFSYKRCVNTIN
ncbi:carbohydrate sulfotransferase 5-like [Penaeus japonicus]|uniref:carbohydrate sulfotransferase 5-like n=1 Tax=Penaeus japonicus TaxID=27405 RepID=UPI001C711F79|nr:carbohydrate sulfotransferase 5-like [Penaeus japonicus]